ncbi:LOW QUALITY PROTEIN: GDSL esterase/lipase At3g14820-like [Carica papaya]|uniref:LOW QUALITY PROTEIN: GDSL esterase/lipase At3g14820-like n=1 Tax=Carica papaya TaxID=3649 RepID=UPI000B8C72EE|nr:LOW QUALITY PROTEIN: GDSL esterase/lipase At3g14820-like [Carica papaya]
MKFFSQIPAFFSFPSLVLSSLLLLMHASCPKGVLPLTQNRTVAAIIAFGDSIVDPGNNNHIRTMIKCNFPPYGRDFPEGKPTGRFSNGKIPSDLLAEGFGIKEFLPAYLDPNLQFHDLLTGVSFASGGAGYDPLTSKLMSVLSLPDQLELFRDYLVKIRSELGEDATSTILSKGIFIVCTGSDDIANTYLSTPFRKHHYDIDSYTDFLVDSASRFLQELHGTGAKKIGVVSLPPIGCVPSQRTLHGGIERRCVESGNDAALVFNSKISAELDSLGGKFPGSKWVYLDIYNITLTLMQNNTQYGFQVTDKGCCARGNIEVSRLCNRFNQRHSCKDASKYLFWDSYHPTEKGYKFITSYMLDTYASKFF